MRDFPDEWSVERSLAPLEAEWRTFEKTAVCTPFQHFDWVANLLTSPPDAQGAVFVLGRHKGILRAVFPLSLVDGSLTWLGERWNNYNAPLIAPELFAALDQNGVDRMWAQIRKTLGTVSVSLLRRQPSRLGLAPNPFSLWAMVREPTFAYARTLGDDWESFYASLHSSGTRRGLARKRFRLAQEGRLESVRIEDPAGLYDHMLRMLEWKSAQVDAMGRRNCFARIESRELFARYAASHPDKIRVYALHLDNRPIAITFLLEGKRDLLLYQMAYEDGPTARYSPGRLLLNDIMQAMIAEGYELLDFSVGDDAYKREICDRITCMTNSFAAHSTVGVAIAMKYRAFTSLKGLIKANPPIYRAVLQANRLFRSLRTG